MTVLSTFLESSLNFQSSNMKQNYKIEYRQGEKRCQNLNCQKHSTRICHLPVNFSHHYKKRKNLETFSAIWQFFKNAFVEIILFKGWQHCI